MSDLFGHVVRDNSGDDCPSGDYKPGIPGGECMSDGHYLCAGCKNRASLDLARKRYYDGSKLENTPADRYIDCLEAELERLEKEIARKGEKG